MRADLRRVLLWFAALTIVAPRLAAAETTAPVAVVCSSGPAFPLARDNANPPDPNYAADKAIDGDPGTFCCLLDDTLSGENAKTIPANAASPVTGHVVFDLGRVMLVSGAKLTARKDSAGAMNPKNVDFFYFADDAPANHAVADDLEHDAGIRPLLSGHTYQQLGSGRSESTAWDGVVARYVGMRVNDSYESGGVHHNFQIGEICFYTSPRPADAQPGQRVPPLYVKRKTLVETLLATRRQYAAWYPAASSQGPAERVWEQIHRDFPPDDHRLLQTVNADWFAATGWLAHSGDTELEQRMLDRVAQETGPIGEVLAGELRSLRDEEFGPEDRRWLGLCVKAAELALLDRRVRNLRAAVEELERDFGQRYATERFAQRTDAFHQRLLETARRPGPSDESVIEALDAELTHLTQEALVRKNPLLDCGKLLFVKRFTYRTGWYYAEFMQANRFGGNLCVLDLADGTVKELLPEMRDGIFDRYDLSADGRRVVFGYKPGPERGFRIYEADLVGREVRPLTVDPPGERERLAAYAGATGGDLGPFRKHTDDFHPCYLPDGGICFASSRCERGVLCDQPDRLSVNTLYRMDADGSGMRVLSQGALSESTPSVTEDGRILYTRWEYVDKGVIAVQALWTMRPDGTGSREVYGNDIEEPPVLIHGRAVPGHPNLVVCTATMHHPFAVGPILRLDVNRDIRTHAPIESLTPDTGLSIEGIGGFPRGENYMHLRNGRWVADNRGPLFCEPYPLSDKFFLVTCNPDRPWNDPAAYGLWLIDTFGNRVPIYHDPEISCWQPMPLRSRTRRPIVGSLAGVAAGTDEASDHELTTHGRQGEATLVMTNVYRGLEGVRPGEVKYVRVLEQVARPWSAHRFWPHDAALGQNAVVGMNAHIYVKVLHGVVPVREDGSACFTVPANRNLFFQALDGDYMELQRMRTFVNLKPGETRSCIGCHEDRPLAPPPGRVAALGDAPLPLRPQPGDVAPRPLHYPVDVQPVWDKHCLTCHNDSRRDGDLDLSGTRTTYFNRSYEELMRKKQLTCIQEFVGPQPRAQKTNVVPLPPRSLGSHASRLVEVLREGHYDCKLAPEEMIRVVTWVDANGPYYGSYFGRRNLMYEGLPDFRPVPTLPSALGFPVHDAPRSESR